MNNTRIAKAVCSGISMSRGDSSVVVKWNEVEYTVVCGNCFGVGAPGNLGHGLHWWNTRAGEPWQQDIEAHVATWAEKYGHVPDDELDAYIENETRASWSAWYASKK